MIGAKLLVKCLEAQGVKRIFGIPGAKIDAVFDALEDSAIELIVCRHEQNAAFMAASHGRLTGEPGVVLVTSGPGVANLTTGLLTATTEGDAVVAIGGNVSREMKLKGSHQNVDNAKLLEAVTKSSVEVAHANAIPEAIANAFRLAKTPHRGACFISLPQDVGLEETQAEVITVNPHVSVSVANNDNIAALSQLINHSDAPVLLLGEESSTPQNTQAIRALIAKTQIPVVGTYQAAGVVSRELVHCFAGRVGLFKNQPGDKLLAQASLVVTIGFNPVEYDPEVWNASNQIPIVHIHETPARFRQGYQPQYELIGDIESNILKLNEALNARNGNEQVKGYHQALMQTIASGQDKTGTPVHPLRFIYELREHVTDDTLVLCDIGSVYMWMARYFLSYEPHHLLFSNGQQTLGVALPWAIGAALSYPDKKIISISGDGGFLFSAMELETAVRENCHFIHFIWRDGSYNMVKEQEVMKYQRKSGVDLGKIDIPDFARSFGAVGYNLESADDFKKLVLEAESQTVPVLINVDIDYSDNPQLVETADKHKGKRVSV